MPVLPRYITARQPEFESVNTMKTASQPASANFASSYAYGDPIPAPEVIDDDSATGWLLWDETVNEGDFLHEMRYASTGPAPLMAMG
jgi:hypothetical protein